MNVDAVHTCLGTPEPDHTRESRIYSHYHMLSDLCYSLHIVPRDVRSEPKKSTEERTAFLGSNRVAHDQTLQNVTRSRCAALSRQPYKHRSYSGRKQE